MSVSIGYSGMRAGNEWTHFRNCNITAYFGSHVVGSAAKRVCRPIQVDLQLAHAEIGDADVTLVVQQDVVQFQVSVRPPSHCVVSLYFVFV